MERATLQFISSILIIVLINECFTESYPIDVSPRTLDKSGDPVTLTWTNLESPSELDWIGIYSPPDSEHDLFIGYVMLSSCINWHSGSCSLNVSLVNLRTPYEFRLFQGEAANATNSTRVDEDGDPLPSTRKLLGASLNVNFANFNEPTQIHLALTSRPGEMRVMFITRDSIRSAVKYGLQTNRLEFVSTTEFKSYTKSDMCGEPANSSTGWRDPGVIHDALMYDLSDGKRYYYQVGSDEGGWSEIFSFVAPVADAEETNALLFGDMGTWATYKTFNWLQAESKNTIKWLQRDLRHLGNKPTLISHIGDISYARGYAWLWDEFFSHIQPVAAQSPYHVCIGNHEYDWPSQPWKPDWASVYGTDGGGECGVPYSMRFHMPGNSSVATGTSSPATKNLFYSLSVGVVHFLYISTETDFSPNSSQYNFMQDDLRRVNRKNTPFVVVLGHRPMFTSDQSWGSQPLQQKMIEYLEPLLIENNVNLVLWGHVHKYERTCPMQNLTCMVGRPVHVVIGMGGQDWQPSWQPRIDHPKDPIYPQGHWSLYRSAQLGYVRLKATKSLLILEYVGNHDGQVHDLLEIPSHPGGVVSDLFCGYSTLSWVTFWFVFALGVGVGLGAFWLFRHFRLKRHLEFPSSKGAWAAVRTEDVNL